MCRGEVLALGSAFPHQHRARTTAVLEEPRRHQAHGGEKKTTPMNETQLRVLRGWGLVRTSALLLKTKYQEEPPAQPEPKLRGQQLGR